MKYHRTHRASLVEIFASYIRNRKLIFQMARREVLGRYRGSIMGLTWSFFNPLLMLAVYTFFFSYIFKARWGTSPGSSHADFAVVLFVGLIIHGLFAECVNRAPLLIIGNVSYVKKVVFPLEIFPWIALGPALFHLLVSTCVLLAMQGLLAGAVPMTSVLFPLILLPLLFMTMGFAWFLSATGVYVRDIGHTTGMITTILMFVSPVFYPMSALPTNLHPLVILNPLTLIIEEARKVLLQGLMPDWSALAVYTFFSLIIMWLGFWWFQKTRKGFADVL